ncbi:Uncharacterised protein [Mycobacteroides abscessus subsp. abscessus]|nr:Uncharacterised protein [Mycobacteroides abscessus subsp. abscessus]
METEWALPTSSRDGVTMFRTIAMPSQKRMIGMDNVRISRAIRGGRAVWSPLPCLMRTSPGSRCRRCAQWTPVPS